MKLTIVGCSDAFSSGGRYQSCYLLDTPDGRVMIDCGATSPLGLERMGIKASSIDAFIFTHCHGDHFGGLPFLFLDRLFVDKTEKPWPIFGPSGIEKRSLDLIEQLYPSLTSMPRGFEIVWSELKPRAVTKWRGLTIEAFEMAHFSGSPSLGLRLGGYGRTVSFSGDSGWCDSVFQLGRGADLYVIECSS